MRRLLPYTLVVLIAMVATAGLIYLTPLRYTRFIQPSIREISPQDFYAKFKQHSEQYLFIDVRPADAYAKEHAVGSVNIPLATLYDLRATLPRTGKTIALICGSNSASGVAYGYLEHYGFSNLLHVIGGVPAWKIAGLPTEGAAVSTTSAPLSCLTLKYLL